MVVLDENETMLAFSIVRTGPRAQMGAQAALEAVCKQLNISKEDFAAIVATGPSPQTQRRKSPATHAARIF